MKDSFLPTLPQNRGISAWEHEPLDYYLRCIIGKNLNADNNEIRSLLSAFSCLGTFLKSYKRGVLSAIFDECSILHMTDINRWKCYKIGDFLSPRIVKQVPSLDAPLMAFTAEGGVCQKGERYDRSFLVKDENKQYKRTEYNDFIYSSNNLDVGSIGLNKFGTAVISDVYEVFTIHNAVPTFISEAIQRKRTLQNILRFRQGVIYGQYRIYADDFLSVEISLPDYETQQKYASLIATIDARILKESSSQRCLEIFKNGLLQQLFI